MNCSRATVLITTKNRWCELETAIESALSQTVPCEVIVIDDGSTDETPIAIPTRFPSVRYVRHDSSEGYIVRRNEGARLASCDVVFSIDDDAAFCSPMTVEQTLAEFDHARIGAVAIPFIDVKKSSEIRQLAPEQTGAFITGSYIGTAHALRRPLFLALGGYRPYFLHQGEEGDYCIRMLANGFVVRLGRADPIHHFESPKRDTRRMDVFGRRNDILFCWYNAPTLALPLHFAAAFLNGLRHGLKCGRTSVMLRGLSQGVLAIGPVLCDRKPVSWQCFVLFRRLKRSKAAVPLDKIEPLLPDMLFV